MKKYILSLFYCLLISYALLAQSWFPQGEGLLPFGYEVTSISVVHDSVIWVSASLKVSASYPVKLFRSIDAGLHWTVTELNACERCKSRQLEAIDATTAWLTIYDPQGIGKLYKTTDGGQNWDLKFSDLAAGNGIIVYDPLHISTRNGLHFAWSEDGGETWETGMLSGISPTQYPASVASTITNDTAWFGMQGLQWYSYETTNAKVIRTTHYGTEFSLMDTGIDSVAVIDFVSFTDSKHGIMKFIKWVTTLDWDLSPAFTWSEQHQLARTIDGGATWSVLPSFLNDIRSITTIPGSLQSVMVTGETQFYKTTDSGETWDGGLIPYPHCCLDFSSPDAGWMAVNGTAGNEPLVLKWNGGMLSGNNEHPKISQMEINLFPNPTNDVIHYDLGINLPVLHTIQITDVTGQVVIQKQTEEQEINLEQLSAGIYFLQIHITDKTGVAKIVKK